MTADELKSHIVNGLPCVHAQVLGDDGRHFEALIVSPEFTGKSRVQQHQRVYEALGERMRSEVHALSLRTFSPEAWTKSIHR
jgi:acid stress-induced BolA-like protein IbaG/YrbA